jgi:predicted P-loop ATPase/GTPase
MDLHDHPINSPPGVLQQIKFEELNILYSQDIIHYAITQTELRLIIEHLPAMSLFNPDINHLILTMMSYYHG